MNKRYVYLAGPILDCTKGQANIWRADVATELWEHNIVGISPLRCEPLIGEKYGLHNEDPKFGAPRAIQAKNLFDVRNCDLTLAYLPKPPAGRHQSFGTLLEIGWAFALGKPVVLVSNDPEIREHPVVNSCCSWILSTLDEGIDVSVGILGGYCGGKNV